MDNRTQLKEGLFKTKAYKIFLEESEKHIEFAKCSFMGKEVVQAQCCSEARIRFHNMKGGAGFFGLGDVAAKAADLERIFKKPVEDMVCELEVARRIIMELDSLVKVMPPFIGESE